MAVLLILAIILICLLIWSWHHTSYWQRRGIPGPGSEIVFGSLRKLGWSNNKSWSFTYRDWTRLYGKYYGIQRGWRNCLVISDAKMAHEVMVSKFELFHERDLAPIAGNVDKDPLTHVFASRGKRWKRLRALTSPAFSVKSLKKVLPTVEYCAAETANLLEKSALDGLPFNIHDYFYEYAMDVICRIGLGLTDSKQFQNKLTHVVKQTLHDIENVCLMASWMVPFLGTVLKYMHLAGALLTQHEFVQMVTVLRKTIDERKKTREGQLDAEETTDFIDIFLDAESEEVVSENNGIYDRASSIQIDKKLTTAEILGQCFLFLFAGFDTTANTLAFTSYYLATHRDVQEKLRREIEEVCLKPNPGYEELNRLKYCEAVMKETLRLQPIAAMAIARKCAVDTRIGDVQIERGTDVVIDTLTLQRDHEIWGVDADKFNPERWLCADVPQSAFYSFGAGPRVCAGMRLAILEEKLMLVHLLRKFRILKTPKTELKVAGFIMHPKEVIVQLEHLK